MKKIRLFVFDDNRERREALRYLAGMYDDMEWVGEAEHASDAIQMMEKHQPDVVLMDIEMPGGDGILGVEQIKLHFPHIKVIMQTIMESDDRVFSAFRNGASGYILKKASPDKIVEGIRETMSGGSPITPSIAAIVLKQFQPARRDHKDYQLTDRELEILQLLANGSSYKMMADKLNIAYHTVNNHVRHIYEKLQVHSNNEAVSKAMKERLI